MQHYTIFCRAEKKTELLFKQRYNSADVKKQLGLNDASRNISGTSSTISSAPSVQTPLIFWQALCKGNCYEMNSNGLARLVKYRLQITNKFFNTGFYISCGRYIFISQVWKFS